MKDKGKWVVVGFLLVVGCDVFAQNDSACVWSLRSCIDYALQHSISVKQKRNSAESAKVDVSSAKAALLPGISASIGQRIINRPNSMNNTFTDGDNVVSTQSRTSYNGSYGVDANWTLYNGGKRINTIRQQQLNRQIKELDVKESENSLTESIMQAYVQIIYDQETVKKDQAVLESSLEQYKQGEARLEAGSIAACDLAQLKAQTSMDRYQLVASQAALAASRLKLKQLLELDGNQEMNLLLPEVEEAKILIPLPDKESIYRTALAIRPEIAALKLNGSVTELDIKIARAGYIPTVSLSAGIGTSHVNGNDFTFSEQVKQNWNNSLGLTLSIPIFDGKQTRNALKKAKIQTKTDQLLILEQQKILYQTIESLWLDVGNAQQRYSAALEKMQSAQSSFNLVQEQFSLGMKNTVELITEKNNLVGAWQEMLQAKYMALLGIELLRFYQGEPCTL